MESHQSDLERILDEEIVEGLLEPKSLIQNLDREESRHSTGSIKCYSTLSFFGD